jgi:hypothetical protein
MQSNEVRGSQSATAAGGGGVPVRSTVRARLRQCGPHLQQVLRQSPRAVIVNAAVLVVLVLLVAFDVGGLVAVLAVGVLSLVLRFETQLRLDSRESQQASSPQERS